MSGRQVGRDRSRTSGSGGGRAPAPPPAPVDDDTFELLRRLLGLSPAAARRVRDAAPRRHLRRPQHGPEVDLGAR